MSGARLFDLRGKRALVTGASGGLGAHLAATLGRAGARLVLAARRADALAAVADRIGASGTECETVVVDVAASDVVAALETIEVHVDILVNNAGLVRQKPALDQQNEDWDEVLDTNLRGAFLTAQWFARRAIAARRGGAIINIASVLGLRQAGGVTPYAVSKAGLIQMTKSLALEWARYDVRVNAIAPGYLDTELNTGFWRTPAGEALVKRIPQRRLGTMLDLDGPLLLLASDASRYMTGAVVAVDGGHLVSSL